MSLNALLNWHRFTVQSNEGVVTSASGGLQRKDGWVTKHLNLHGHLQTTNTSTSRGRNDLILDRKLRELETYFTLWHKYSQYELKESNRLLINKDPRLELNIFPSDENTNVFELIGEREPVAKPGFYLYEVYLKQIRWQTI